MKKRIQKYLSGSNEGFSLVELIIVIAIMAILVGVVALAVIPYLEKSRESKDLQALDTLASAATSAVADAQVTGSGGIEIANGAATGDGTDAAGETKVIAAIKTTLGDALPTFSSNTASSQKAHVKWDTTKNIVYVYVEGGSEATLKTTVTVGSGTNAQSVSDVAMCKYNDQAPLCISNTKVAKGTSAGNGGN